MPSFAVRPAVPCALVSVCGVFGSPKCTETTPIISAQFSPNEFHERCIWVGTLLHFAQSRITVSSSTPRWYFLGAIKLLRIEPHLPSNNQKHVLISL